MVEQPVKYQVGDKIEHQHVPGFWMTIEETAICEGGEHLCYRITDFTGHVDWLCAYDVRRDATEQPYNVRKLEAIRNGDV